MILDCFTFHNEIEMLLVRLHYLHDLVDHFVISESDRTHTGVLKPKYLKQYWNAIPEKIRGKIVCINAHLENDDGKIDARWVREHFQRSSLIGAIRRHITTSNAIVIISDVDEIPHRDLLVTLRRTDIDRVVKLEQDCLIYNYKTYFGAWDSSLVGPIELLEVSNVNKLRLSKSVDILENCGWHFSYFLSPADIVHKLKSYVHTEFNTSKIADEDTIRRLISERRDILQRSDRVFEEYDSSKIPKDLKNLLNLYFPVE